MEEQEHSSYTLHVSAGSRPWGCSTAQEVGECSPQVLEMETSSSLLQGAELADGSTVGVMSV